MNTNSMRNVCTNVKSTLLVAAIAMAAACVFAMNTWAQLMNTGSVEAPSPMAALLGYQPQPQHQMVNLALGHQFFVPNEGQWSDATVQYGLHADHWSIAFRDGGAIELILRKAKPEPAGPEPTMRPMEAMGLTHNPMDSRPTQFDETSVTLTFPGCNAAAKPVGIHPTPTKVNYFVGGKDRESAAGLATYTGIEYPNLYNGIDLFIRGNEADGTLKYEFHVAAGADASQIQMHYQGLCSPLTQSSAGDLRIPTNLGTLTDHAPFAYQGSKKIGATYALTGEDQCHISLGDGYDPAQPVVIDPEVEWMMYLGGSDDDYGRGVAVGYSNSVLVIGSTTSIDFDGKGNDFHGGSYDAWIVKVSASGSLQWMTYLGGSDDDSGYGIAVDNSGNVLGSGFTTSTDFEGRNNIYHGGDSDSFLVRISGSSGVLQWMTYLGGSEDDVARGGIASDSASNALVTGYTGSSDFEGRNNTNHGGPHDAFIVKVSPDGATRWMTYLGGSYPDFSWGQIAVDASDGALVAGETWSEDFEGRNNSYHGGLDDAFAVKVSASGAVLWMTYLGGEYTEEAYGDAAVDSSGNVFVAGSTGSPDFEGRNNEFHGQYYDTNDAFVAKVSGDSGTLQWMTYLGGWHSDYGYGIAVDRSGNALVTGDTYSTDFEGRNNTFHSPGGDAFLVRVAGDSGTVQGMLYLGGSGDDAGNRTAVDSTGDDALVAGSTTSTDFEGTNNTFHGGGYYGRDAFVVKVSLTDNTGPQLTIDASCPDAGPIQVSWTGATPNGNAALIFARHQGTFTIPQGQPCAGTPLGLGNQQIQIVWSGRSDANGGKTIHANVGAGVCGSFLQLLDLSDCQTSNVAAIQ